MLCDPSPLPVVACVTLVPAVVALAAEPAISPPLPEVALARLVSVPPALTPTCVISAPLAIGAAIWTLLPSAALVAVLDVARASLKPAATMPTARPDASACWRVVFSALTATVPSSASTLPSPTRPLTRLAVSAWADVAVRPANRAPEAPVALADTLGPVPASCCVADTVRLRPASRVPLPKAASSCDAASAVATAAPAAATMLRFTPSDSAAARVWPVAATRASCARRMSPPVTKALTSGVALAVATEPLSARPRPAAAATAWLSVCTSDVASTVSARTASPGAAPMRALPPMVAAVVPSISVLAIDAPAT